MITREKLIEIEKDNLKLIRLAKNKGQNEIEMKAREINKKILSLNLKLMS
jgi:hypothetical protein